MAGAPLQETLDVNRSSLRLATTAFAGLFAVLLAGTATKAAEPKPVPAADATATADAGLGRWVWSKADAAGNLRYAMGEGSTQPARMFDLRGTDAERQRALERRAPELARLFTIQGARPMLRLDATGRWGLGPTPCVSSVFDEMTGERWEWHADVPSRVMHAGGSRWRVHDGWYLPGG